MGRFWEGTSLLHQMRGEWFDSVSCLMTFSRGALAAKLEEVTEFRHTLVRLMSLCHGSALEEIKDSESDRFEVLDISGLDAETLLYLHECKQEHKFNRVEVLLHMIQVLVTQGLDDGVLKIAPPILSRVYQTLSRGLVNLLNATKIKNTRFPFPYAQLIACLLVLHTIWTPFMLSTVLEAPWWASSVSYLLVTCLYSLNLTASELEMPFGHDENDLPLDQFQHDMNRALLMLLNPKADILPHTSRACEWDLQRLAQTGLQRHEELTEVPKESVAGRRTLLMRQLSKALSTRNVEESSQCGGSSMFEEAVAMSAHASEAGSEEHEPVAKVKSGVRMTPAPLRPLDASKVTVVTHCKDTEVQRHSPGQRPAVVRSSSYQLDEEGGLDDLLSQWAQRADEQVDAIRRNTAVVARLAEAFPSMLGSEVTRSKVDGPVEKGPALACAPPVSSVVTPLRPSAPTRGGESPTLVGGQAEDIFWPQKVIRLGGDCDDDPQPSLPEEVVPHCHASSKVKTTRQRGQPAPREATDQSQSRWV